MQIAHIIRQLLENGSVKIKGLNLKIKRMRQKIKQELISIPIKSGISKTMQLKFYY